MAPSGLYASICHAFLVFNIFNGLLSHICFSEANRPIFTKISGLVDGCKGLFSSFRFFDFSRVVSMATN